MVASEIKENTEPKTKDTARGGLLLTIKTFEIWLR